jgi:hypothetical protein
MEAPPHPANELPVWITGTKKMKQTFWKNLNLKLRVYMNFENFELFNRVKNIRFKNKKISIHIRPKFVSLRPENNSFLNVRNRFCLLTEEIF